MPDLMDCLNAHMAEKDPWMDCLGDSWFVLRVERWQETNRVFVLLAREQTYNLVAWWYDDLVEYEALSLEDREQLHGLR